MPIGTATTGHVVDDGRPVLGDEHGWWSYDPEADEWARLPEPDGRSTGVAQRRATAASTPTSAVDRCRSSTSPPGSGRALPVDPLAPRLTDASVFATDAGVVLSGVNYHEAAPDEPTLDPGVDLWDGDDVDSGCRATGMIGPL